MEEFLLLLEGYGVGIGGVDLVKVCINDQLDCCKWVVFEVLDCLGLDGVCLDFELFVGFQSLFGDGIGELQEVGIQGGVFFGYFLGDFCLCFMEVVDLEDLNFFDLVEGQVVEFMDVELYFEFLEFVGEVFFDYFIQEMEVYLMEDDFNVLILFDIFIVNIFVILLNGNIIKCILYVNINNFLEVFWIVIIGEVIVMRILGIGFLDNFCWFLVIEEVWLGDVNVDNLVYYIDLLLIGLGYGVFGLVWVNQDNFWSFVVVMNWDSIFVDGINYKYVDCNGDGIIDEVDCMVLMDNYGLLYGVFEFIIEFLGIDLDLLVFINFLVDQFSGVIFQVFIFIGLVNMFVQNVYGVVFIVQFDFEVINFDEIEVVYFISWFGEFGVNIFIVDKVYLDGCIEIVMIWIDQNNVFGYGQVVYIIGIIDDIVGFMELEVFVEKIFCIDLEENCLLIQGREIFFKVVFNEEVDFGSGLFIFFLNLVIDWVNIVSFYGFEVDQI